jgi:hypothetical protein
LFIGRKKYEDLYIEDLVGIFFNHQLRHFDITIKVVGEDQVNKIMSTCVNGFLDYSLVNQFENHVLKYTSIVFRKASTTDDLFCLTLRREKMM